MSQSKINLGQVMLITLILKNMVLEILEVVEDNLLRETACRVAAGAVAKVVLKKIIGIKFNIIGAVTQLGLMSCDKRNWKNSEIRKKSLFLPR